MSRDLSEASEERRWASRPNLSDPKKRCEVKTPETSSEELSSDPDCKAETSPPPEMDPKGNLKGKGKRRSSTKGWQRAPNPKLSKGKGEDPHGTRKDLARIEQKVDTLLQKMDQFTKEARTPPPAAEEEKEKTPKPQQPQPPQPPPAPPLPVWKVPQQQHQGGKGQRSSKAGTKAVTKAAPAKVGGGASGGAVGKSA